MTINRAISDGVRFVRLPQWEPSAHIELPLLGNGLVGPWAIVRDVSGETSLFIGALRRDTESRYEAWAPPPATNAVDPHAQPSGTPSPREQKHGA
jgi:hypothetical protein